MPRLNYLAALDAIHYYQTYQAIVNDLKEEDLRTVLLLILNGEDIRTAFDIAMAMSN